MKYKNTQKLGEFLFDKHFKNNYIVRQCSCSDKIVLEKMGKNCKSDAETILCDKSQKQ